MDNTENENKEYVNKLNEIKRKQRELKNLREQVVSSRPWYKSPQNILGLLAIVIPILVSVFFKLFDEKEKHLLIEYSDPVKLLSSDRVNERSISVNYDSLQIQNISNIKISFTNIGDIPIRKQDFGDGPILLTIKDRSSTNKGIEPPFILNAFKIDEAKHQNSVLSLVEQKNPGKVAYLPSLINPGEKVEVAILLSNDPLVAVEISAKIDDGTVDFKMMEKLNQDNFQPPTALEKILKVFHNSYIKVPILIFLILILLIVNIGFWVTVSGGDMSFDPPSSGRVIAFLFSLISIILVFVYIILI